MKPQINVWPGSDMRDVWYAQLIMQGSDDPYIPEEVHQTAILRSRKDAVKRINEIAQALGLKERAK